ncbi:MAG: DUF1553 domain-containing protein, partial [Flavisolibacter sp.]
SEHQFIKTWQPAVNSLKADEFINCELSDTKWLAFRNKSSARLTNIDLNNKNEIIFRYVGYVPGNLISIYLDKPGGTLIKKFTLGKTKDWMIDKIDLPLQSGTHNLYFTYTNNNLKKPTDNGMMFDWFYFTDQFPGKGKADYDSIQKKWWHLITVDVPTTPVMMDNPNFLHRTTHVFERGNWLVKGNRVDADVPHSLNPFPAGMAHNRLGLAKWITDKKNPLTARTMVNRVWEQIFGIGLVETLDDLGTQGAEPSNRDLLDYLSYQFMYEYNWSVKKLVKELVMSAAYRQNSKVDKDKLDKDPDNRYCSRGPRIRLSAEEIRDQAMAVSGLLNEKMFGPSVMPWQPEGIWMSPWNGDYWKEGEGGEQYRRALYTFWKRTAPYPSMITFDGVGREVCTARRIRTNTPLQALVTLNDSVYLVASRSLAYKMESMAKPDDIRSMISKGYESILFHSISSGRLNALEELYNNAYEKLKNDPEATCNVVSVNNKHNNPHTAALVIVASALLNLDEVITKN